MGLQDALEKERQKTQQLLEEKERLAAERERLAENTVKAIEELEARHNASNQALYELFVVSHLFIFTQRMHVMFVYTLY